MSMSSINALESFGLFPAALNALSTFVVTLDQHPFGAFVLIVILIAVVVIKKPPSRN